MLVNIIDAPGTGASVTEYHAQFPSLSASVGKARRAVVAFARRWFRDVELSDIESAVGEALANCAEHGYVNGTFIDVLCRFADGELTIDIKDAGEGFDRWDATDYLKPLSAAPRGYGTYIMRRLMDEIEYSDRGSRVRLIKRRAGDAAARDVRGQRFG
jgi:anti-sigma regulatory factor (Ser/Thr protein kinase)